MENDVKMNYLIQRKYNNQKEYEEYLCTWKISREQVDEYERKTNFEYKKRLERERKEKERKAKAVANKDTVEEKMWQINLEAARRIKGETENKIERPKIITRVLLIDGDNNSDCIEGLNEVKDYFQDIFCWTNNEGLKKKLKSKYDIKVYKVENKPQAADMMIRTTVGKVLKDNKYSEIFILSHDKGYRDVVDGKKVIQVKTIKEIQLRKIKNQKCLN